MKVYSVGVADPNLDEIFTVWGKLFISREDAINGIIDSLGVARDDEGLEIQEQFGVRTIVVFLDDMTFLITEHEVPE